jgi:hypothetical protein
MRLDAGTPLPLIARINPNFEVIDTRRSPVLLAHDFGEWLVQNAESIIGGERSPAPGAA